MRLLLATLGLALLPTAYAAGPPAPTLTIYRCVAADGRLSLRDSPCEKGETQQMRSMRRPQDPPPGTAAVGTVQPSPAPPPAAPAPQVVYRTPPQPMYECLAPDGTRYTADNGEGNPRWVPLWTLGYPVQAPVTVVRPPRGEVRVDNGRASGRFRSGDQRHVMLPTLAGQGAGTWVRDSCTQLPPQEACAKLADRRYEIQRRYYSALQSERRELEREQRGIDARLANDCTR